MSADLNTVKIAIRAVLQSSKHGMTVRQLIGDYRDLNGTLIPFKVFGFRNIDDFLRSIPDTVTLQNRGGDTIVHYTQCEETAHIEKFVKGQRGSKKKPQRSRAPKPLGHRRQGNQQGPARRATTVPRFTAASRQTTPKQVQRGSSNNASNDWSDWSNHPATKSSNDSDLWECNQSQTNKLNSASWSQAADDWSSASATVSPHTKKPNTPKPSTSYSAQKFSKDKQITSNNGNNAWGESTRKTTPPRNTHQSPPQLMAFEKPSDSFSKYTSNAIPERTVIFENQVDLSKTSKTVSVKPDLKITRRDTGIVVTKNRESISSGSRTSSPSPSYKALLMDLATELQLGSPVYKSLGVNDKNSKRIQYLGIVEVNGVKWLSHPSSFPNPDEAEEEAAHKAYDALKSNQKVPKSEAYTGEKNKIISNIAEILSANKTSLWFHKGVEEEYFKRFNQNLPPNWLDVVDSCDRFDVERQEFFNKVVITVALANPSLKKKTAASPLPSSKQTESPKDFGVTDSQLDTQTMPESLVLPGSETWDVIVTKVIAANEVVVRLFDNDDQYVELVDQMHSYYTDNPQYVNDVIVGKLYAAKFDETTYRVHVQKVDGYEVTCVYVDEGGEEKIQKSCLHELLSKFLLLPFQAFSCLLADLKYCASSEFGRNYLEEMINKVSNSALIAMPTQREHPIEIKLFDTSNPEDKDLNEELNNYLKRHYYDDFFKPGVTAEISVLEVSDTGDFKVQIMDKLFHRLEAAQTSVNTTCNHKLTRLPTLEELYNLSPLWCCYSLFDGNWYRAEVLEANSEEKIRVVYPDYGNEEETNISNLRLVDASLDPLHFIPYLVSSKCRLDNVPKDDNMKWCKKTTEKYNEIVGDAIILEMKVIHKATSFMPSRIELFLNVNNDPIAVNMKLAACKEVFEIIDENCAQNSRKESLPDILIPKVAPVTNGIKNGHPETNTLTPNVMLQENNSESDNININRLSIHGDDYLVGSNDPIPEPVMPAIKPIPAEDTDFFDVFVTLAANPYNFTVTPYESKKPDSEMTRLADEMQAFYDSPENIIELNAYMIKRGQFLAVKWTDDLWYRVRVETIVERDPLVVMCYFIDYGDIHVINSDRIQPLFSQFRKLPMQAMRASLANITPVNGDWEVIACRGFAQMVEQKAFVATVTDIVIEEDNRPTLKLILCDTTGETDFFINSWLVEERYAITSV